MGGCLRAPSNWLSCLGLILAGSAGAEIAPTIDIDLTETLRLEGESSVGLIGNVTSIAEVGQRALLLDRQLGSIQALELESGEGEILLTPGEGPGELEHVHWMAPMGDALVVGSYMPRKLKVLWPGRSEVEGLALVPDQKILAATSLGGTEIITEQSGGRWEGGKLLRRIRFGVMSLDDAVDGGEIETSRVIGETLPTAVADRTKSGKLKWVEQDFRSMTELPPRWAAGNDRVYIASDYSSYLVSVFDGEGNELAPISRPEYENRRRTDDEMRWHRDLYPDQEVKLESSDPAIVGIFTRSNGELWVLPNDGCNDPDKDRLEFDVFDHEQQHVGRVRLNIDLGLGRALPLSTHRDGIFLTDRAIYISTELRSSFAGELEELPPEPTIIRLQLPDDIFANSR